MRYKAVTSSRAHRKLVVETRFGLTWACPELSTDGFSHISLWGRCLGLRLSEPSEFPSHISLPWGLSALAVQGRQTGGENGQDTLGPCSRCTCPVPSQHVYLLEGG